MDNLKKFYLYTNSPLSSISLFKNFFFYKDSFYILYIGFYFYLILCIFASIVNVYLYIFPIDNILYNESKHRFRLVITLEIGTIIKIYREQQCKSINEIADKANISQSTLSRIEAGMNSPTFDVLERIIKALGLSLIDFFSTNKSDLEPDLKRLLDAAKNMTPKQIKALQIFLETLKID